MTTPPPPNGSANLPEISGPVPFRARGFVARPSAVAAVGTLVGLIALWQWGAREGVISTQFLPTPAAIIRALIDLARSGELWRHLSASLVRLAIGWTLGTVAGIAVGFLLGIVAWTRSPGMAVVSALFPIPKIALVPLFIIWFGIGEGSKLATLGFGVFFPTVIATAAGIDAVPRNLVRMGQAFGLRNWTIISRIVLPGALPSILAGFRLTTSIAIILLVAAEMIGAERGIGAFVLQAGNLYDTDNLLAGIVVLSLLGLTVAWLIGILERVLLRWR